MKTRDLVAVAEFLEAAVLNPVGARERLDQVQAATSWHQLKSDVTRLIRMPVPAPIAKKR